MGGLVWGVSRVVIPGGKIQAWADEERAWRLALEAQGLSPHKVRKYMDRAGSSRRWRRFWGPEFAGLREDFARSVARYAEDL